MKNIVPITVVLITAWVILLIPFKIIGVGFMPPDDALWHSAKAVSGKNWSEVMVLRDNIKIESHPGWHAILRAIYMATKCDTHLLVMFSVITLFILFVIIPIFLLRYPESWILSLLALSVIVPSWFFRLFLGRPYIVTMAVVLSMFLIWPKLKEKKTPYLILIIITASVAGSTWIHRTFYILLIPVVALLLAREWKAALYMAICSVAGIFIGASLTGHPALFIKQTILHMLLVFGGNDAQGGLVSELRPGLADFNIIVVILGILGWRAFRGLSNKGVIRDPIFIMMVLSLIGVFVTRRVWLDFGVPCVAIWIAKEFDYLFYKKINRLSWSRILIALTLSAVLYLSITTDVENRWSRWKPLDYLSASDPEQKEWLPGPGGIIYSDNMQVFFKTVYKNPTANWRYMLGSEAAIMPEEDLKTLRNIQNNLGTYNLFYPWVKKMRPEDRLILMGDREHKPNIPELEWNYTAINTWIGRKPNNRKN